MRAELGPFALIAGYCFAGLGVLAALRLVRMSGRGVAAGLGLAFVVGVALISLMEIWLLSFGASIGIAALAVLAALIGGGGFVVAWRRAGSPRPSLRRSDGEGAPRTRASASRWSAARARRSMRRLGADRWTAIVVIGALAIFAVLSFRWALVQPLQVWDSWSIWARKGTLLYDYGHIPTAFFTSQSNILPHPDYPLLVPVYESSWFHAVGAANTQNLHVWFWFLFAGFLWATAYLASRVARPLAWAPLVGLIAVTPAIWNQLMTMYADVPMGLFLMLGVLSLGIWLTGRRPRDLALSAILLAAAASTKNEGLTAVVSVLVVAVVFALVMAPQELSRLRALRPLGFAIAGVVAALAPWRLWLSAHHIEGEMPVSKALSPSFLLSHTGRIGPSFNALFSEVANQGSWAYLLPIAIALLIAGLATPRLRSIAGFYGLATVGAGVLILWAYEVTPRELNWLIFTSASRTVVGPMMVAIAGTFHLAGALTRNLQRTAPSASRERDRRGTRAQAPRRARTRRAPSASSR
jgi:hypothetical protein